MKKIDRCNWEECQAKPLLYKAIKENEERRLEVFPIFVKIRRQWNSWRIGEIDFYNLRNIKWDWTSGGVNAPSPHPFIYAYVLCDQIIGEIDHSCMHGPAPHLIKVVIVKKDNTAEVWKIIQGIAGPKPGVTRTV